VTRGAWRVAKEKGDQDRMSISAKLRLEGKDYSAPGYYFVTLCTDERRRLFGRLVGE